MHIWAWATTRIWCMANPGKKTAIVTPEGTFVVMFRKSGDVNRMDDFVFPQDRPGGEAGKARAGGLTLRDYFASKAPPAPQWVGLKPTAQDLAKWAYDYADAMMELRQR